jgi:hypothetical protein
MAPGGVRRRKSGPLYPSNFLQNLADLKTNTCKLRLLAMLQPMPPFFFKSFDHRDSGKYYILHLYLSALLFIYVGILILLYD